VQARSNSRNKERVWVSIKVAAKVDTAMDVRGNFIRRHAQNARRNAKFLSSQVVIVRSIARIAIPKRRAAAAESSTVFGFALSTWLKCHGQMRVISFIEASEAIKKIR